MTPISSNSRQFTPISFSGVWASATDPTFQHRASAAPSIGQLLCETQNKMIAEYALRGVDRPLGNAAYALADALPDELEGQLLSVEALKKELGRIGDE